MAISPGGRSADDSPLGKGPLFGTPGLKLHPYIREVAHALIRAGHDRSQAIRMAIGILENWRDGKGKVRPQVRAAAGVAVAHFHAQAAIARATPNR